MNGCQPAVRLGKLGLLFRQRLQTIASLDQSSDVVQTLARVKERWLPQFTRRWCLAEFRQCIAVFSGTQVDDSRQEVRMGFVPGKIRQCCPVENERSKVAAFGCDESAVPETPGTLAPPFEGRHSGDEDQQNSASGDEPPG